MDILRLNTICIPCIYNKFIGSVSQNCSEEKRLDFAKGILKIIAESPNSSSAPEIVYECTRYKNEVFGVFDDFKDLKTYFNKLMLGYEREISEKISISENSLRSAVCYALLGNYIDFGAMNKVDEDKLTSLINNAENMKISNDEFERLKKDLEGSKTLVYLTDNCGEIVLDKLFIKEIKKIYPELDITVIVRGENVLNDATVFDAKEIGLEEVARVIPNGTGIAGTCIERLPENVKNTVLSADVIISKGQGNFETLFGRNLNTYFIFMCKCKMFADRFNVEPLTPMLINDLRLD